MTNNPTIDGVSRELRKRLDDLTDKAGGMFVSVAELRDLLDAPAVERQEPVKWWNGCNETVPKALSISPITKGRPAAKKLYEATPEVAALQSRIDQLEAEAMYAAATYQAARARIEELESGRAETFGWVVVSPEYGNLSEVQTTEDSAKDMAHDMDGELPSDHSGGRHTIKPLFTAPQAPVAVLLPDRVNVHSKSVPFRNNYIADGYISGWNACLDATAALNEGKS